MDMDNEKLVAEVFARKPLWDVNNKHYHKHSVNHALWDSVASALHQDSSSVKKRWKNLRDTHRQELKKIKYNVIPSSKWALFEAMNFLVPVAGEEKQNPGKTSKKVEKRKLNNKTNQKDETSSCDNILKVLEAIEKEKLLTLREDKKLKNDADYNFLIGFLPLIKSLSSKSKIKFQAEMCRTLMEIKQEDDDERAGIEKEKTIARKSRLLQKTRPPPPRTPLSIQAKRKTRQKHVFGSCSENESD